MNDAYVNALNTQRSTSNWMNAVTENMVNIYTPGYREKQMSFKTFLNGAVVDNALTNHGQGKSAPGTSPENVYLEGQGFFALRNDEGKMSYTRLGEFKFDGSGVYKNADGQKVQGYILNDRGEIMSGTKSLSDDVFNKTLTEGGAMAVPTTEIKLWIDPDNGKYLGKYDEYEIKEDGVLYGKANSGKDVTPLYKIATMNFHNPQGLFQYEDGVFAQTEDSGNPVIGRGDIRSGLIENSNTDFKANITHYQEAKMQMELSNKLLSSYKELLQSALQLMG